MRRISTYTLDREPFEKALLTYRDKTGKHVVELSCGSQDEVEVFREGKRTYVLTYNTRCWYAGIEAFEGKDKVGELFLQSDTDLEGILGQRTLDLSPMTMVKRMKEYL